MIVDDSFNYHARLNTNYHRLSCSLDMCKFNMIVDDSFYRLNERMIVYDSFSANGLVKNGLKPCSEWELKLSSTIFTV